MNPKKATLLIFILSVLIVFTQTGIFAQGESTPSGSVDEIQKSLQDRIKKALDENLNTAEQTLQQAQNRAVVGIIDSLTQNQITVKVNPNTSAEYLHQISYTPDTTLSRSGKTINAEGLEIGNYIIAIGISLPANNSLLEAKRVTVAAYSEPTIYSQIFYVTISNIDLDNDTITLQNSHPQLEKPLNITKNTTILLQNNPLQLANLQLNQKAVAVLTINTTKKTTSLSSLIIFPNHSATTPTEAVSETQPSSCGDGVCQNVACFGLDCPEPETPETCPADCAG